MIDDELSAAVAENVMGWTRDAGEWWSKAADGTVLQRTPITCWEPHKNWNVTAQVIEAMRSRGWRRACAYLEDRAWTAAFGGHPLAKSGDARADTFPRAVCLAALAALEAERG